MEKRIQKHILITGPESTAKTEISRQLSSILDGCFIPEFARDYLENLDRPYELSDLACIAKGQLELATNTENCAYVIHDTFLYNIKIWSEWKYGICDPFILNNLSAITFDHVLIMYPDLPWTPDPLRETKGYRKVLFNLFKNEIESAGLPYSIIKGSGVRRLENCLNILNNLVI